MPNPALPDLVWDPLLAQVAYDWASQCQSSSGVMLDHNADRASDYATLGGTGSVGENAFASTGEVTVGQSIGLWMEEASDYTYATDSCSGVCGHYTQLVWRASVRVGCALAKCSALEYPNTLVCNYSPAGNYLGQQPY